MYFTWMPTERNKERRGGGGDSERDTQEEREDGWLEMKAQE